MKILLVIASRGDEGNEMVVLVSGYSVVKEYIEKAMAAEMA
jgi:hypothetical protein